LNTYNFLFSAVNILFGLNHAVMKDDLAGGSLPSVDFAENAAWWWIMIRPKRILLVKWA